VKKAAFILKGRVEAVLVASNFGDHVSRTTQKIQVVRGHGVRGDGHAGPRLVDARERELLDFGVSKGSEIANHREFSAVSDEELSEIAAGMDLPSIPHGCLGENLVVSGIPRFTMLPTGTLLFFRKNAGQDRTAVLVVWKENKPCVAPGEAIASFYANEPTLPKRFPKAAMGKRGVVGSVYCSGIIHEHDEVVVMVPEQRIYEP
jgi:hypothetical protein